MRIEIIILIVVIAVIVFLDFYLKKRGMSKSLLPSINLKKNKKSSLIILSVIIILSLGIYLIDKQMYRQTLFADDGISILDKISLKNYNLDDTVNFFEEVQIDSLRKDVEYI